MDSLDVDSCDFPGARCFQLRFYLLTWMPKIDLYPKSAYFSSLQRDRRAE